MKINVLEAKRALAELTGSRLLEPLPNLDPTVALPADGTAKHDEIRVAVDEVTSRLYGNLPVDDLAAEARVLTIVATRANELAVEQEGST